MKNIISLSFTNLVGKCGKDTAHESCSLNNLRHFFKLQCMKKKHKNVIRNNSHLSSVTVDSLI